MFNFHKPRTYRSTEGCCICRAKSSSSRFTDSRKYERDTMLCFDLKYPRQGEICNACVLLVKRFKRLPVGSKRNWSHVVDARAGGPGGSKLQTKYKSERISSRAAQQQQQQTNNTNYAHSPGSSSSSLTDSGHINGATSPSSANSMSSFIPEKFSKIFKKSKKIKDITSSNGGSKRKSTNNGWSQNIAAQSSSVTPDPLDSDYEDTRLHGNLAGVQGGTVVQFQTQTRASAYKAQAAAEARKRIIKLGTKRRKCLPPRKYRRSIVYEESVQFFDDEEWQEQKSCCGMMYECPALGGALIVDVTNYKPCELHQPRTTTKTANTTPQQQATTATNVKQIKSSFAPNAALVMPLQKSSSSIIQTMPAVVQLQPPQGPPPSISLTHCSSNFKSSLSSSSSSIPTTPVLKKHHLFYKRQSECFPQVDMVNINKPESDFHMPQHQYQHQYNTQSTTSQRHLDNAAIQHSSSTTILTNPCSSSSSALSISVTSSSANSFTASSMMPQMPKHSLARVTTISPTASHHLNTNTITTSGTMSSLSKPNSRHSFLHKLKSDSGKIVKHSLEKFNTAVRLRTTDLHEMKPIIKTVDKSYILAKPPTQCNINTLNNVATTTTYQTLASYNATAQPLTTTSLSAASPTSSTSSTSSTKFSDNSSDSGFDENMLDRKSASPLQEDCEKKLLSRPGVQTMFLASGVQIQGQPQNLVLTGNEVAAKILQNRKYNSITNSATSNHRSLTSNHPTTTAVKIAQISTTPLTGGGVGGVGVIGGPPTIMSSAAQAKMRAIYNNNNTIQHENGITTIVPASSLAATSQISAMQNIAPSTVTITPAPPLGTQYNPQNHVISRKLTTANIINLQSNTNLSNSTNINNHLNNLSSSSSATLSAVGATNQKIILLKTSPNTTTLTPTSSLSASSAASAAAAMMTKYNSVGEGGGGITR